MAQAIVKKQAVEYYGPYGSKLPQNYSLQLEDGERFKEVIVTSGSIVDSIGFVVAKRDGTTATYQFGGPGFYEGKVVLKDGEYLTRISGTFGNSPKYLPDNGVLIATMTIHTNLNPNGYGPFGKGIDVENVEKYSSPTTTDGPIVGFLGRNGMYLESAGVMIRKQVIEIYGPYGSQLSENYRMQLQDGERFKEVIVRYGSIVDSLGLVVAKRDGTTTTYQFGGPGFYEGKVVLKDGEYLTRISGTFGNSPKYLPDNGVLIATMTIHTNLNPNGYGPFGKGIDVENVEKYSSPTTTDGPIVGFLGRNGMYLESTGVMIRKEFPPKKAT
ncbi:mannose/glucose-specific lectin-like isoform X2 [Spinacia oleracea]|uniref:Mannose/glucose-specific lectin-like isoform X2 n=1 Tax=Spinacia oleracea TaxID=3562 RepID=A0ABM3RVS7_SPIOL|nr:mannose/glucose-specific lectin-like isoform X2 [Spinacia oleracea]